VAERLGWWWGAAIPAWEVDVGNPAVRVWALLAVLAAAGLACDQSPRAAAERLSGLNARGAELERALEDVEERLVGNQARVHMWEEMGRRHEHVSALACENVSAHVVEMAKRLDVQHEKRRVRRGRPHARSPAMSAVQLNAGRSRNN
jgi:hypothetical protein